jgi:hypothetical protein
MDGDDDDDDDNDTEPESGRCFSQQCRHTYMRRTMFHLCDRTPTVMPVSALLYPIIGQLGIAIYRPLRGMQPYHMIQLDSPQDR